MNVPDRVVLLACGRPPPSARSIPEVASVSLPTRPGREALDAVLAAHDPQRLVVLGTDADVAAIVLRLLRTDRLDVEVGYAPIRRRSFAAAAWGLPARSAAALRLALEGVAEPVPLVRDDAGGVLVGRGELPGVRGESYCDDQLMLRGWTRRLVVTPGPAGVRVAVAGGRLRRPRRAGGRAVQVGCEPATVICDGVPHPRLVQRWTWYRHTVDLRLAR